LGPKKGRGNLLRPKKSPPLTRRIGQCLLARATLFEMSNAHATPVKFQLCTFLAMRERWGTEPEPLEQGTERWRWFADADRETRAAHPRTIIISPRATAAGRS